MKLKKIIKQMTKLQKNLEQIIVEREEKFETKSEKWKNSEKGTYFQETTDVLVITLCNTSDSIDSLSL